MLTDKQRETVKDYFKRNPNATPQDIEKLLGFEMDIATTIETGLLKIEASNENGDSKTKTGSVSGRVEIEFCMMDSGGSKSDLACSIASKPVHLSNQDVATKLRGYILKKVMRAISEKFSAILQDGAEVQRMINDAEDEIKKEFQEFTRKEGV